MWGKLRKCILASVKQWRQQELLGGKHISIFPRTSYIFKAADRHVQTIRPTMSQTSSPTQTWDFIAKEPYYFRCLRHGTMACHFKYTQVVKQYNSHSVQTVTKVKE